MRRLFRLGVLGAALIAAHAGGPARAGEAASCPTPPGLLVLKPVLTFVAAKIAKRERLTILAMGSSSTEGAGASAPTMAYPSRLEAELKRRFPEIEVRVINRGKGGEDAPEELARLERDIVAEDPDLVIWQIGTNAVLRSLDPALERDVLRRGIAVVRQSAADVVLMDLQYAPRVLARPAYATMEKLIAEVAERNRVGLFRRFEIMRHWQSAAPGAGAAAISPDGLHMTDQSYGCLAAGLADAIAENWRQYRQAERSPDARLARVAGPADSAGSEDR
jgi:lysophospholipase L1-like esterase